MFTSRVERRFYQTFFRWHRTITPLNDAARKSRRLLSSSGTRRTSASDEATSSDEPSPTAQPPISAQGTLQGTLQGPPASDGQGKQKLSEEDERLHELRESMRNIFCCVAHPVAIVTALGESNAGENGAGVSDDSSGEVKISNEWEDVLKTLRAMTVSSLNTVSLNPRPIISFNVRIPSSTWDAIRTQGRFRVFLLRSTERALEIATLFAKGDATEGFRTVLAQGTPVQLNRPGGILRMGAESLEWKVVEEFSDPNPAPYIKTGALVGCLVAHVLPEKCVQVNDHIIVVAEVEYHQGVSREFSQQGGHPRNPALSYFNHGYVRVDRPVVATAARKPRSMQVVTAPNNVRSTRVASKPDGTDGQSKVKDSKSLGTRRVRLNGGIVRKITFFPDGTTYKIEVDPESADYGRQDVSEAPIREIDVRDAPIRKTYVSEAPIRETTPPDKVVRRVRFDPGD